MPSQVIVVNNLPLLTDLVRKAAADVLIASGMEMDADIKQSFTGPKSGVVYKRGKKGSHQASAPGEAPAIDTGNLTNSQGVDTSDALSALTVIVYNTAQEAEPLEMGTGKMAPRPFMTPAAEKQRKRLPERMAAALSVAQAKAQV